MTDRSIAASYDDLADVLYVDARSATPSEYLEDADGLIWRFDGDGLRYGVTVQDCQHRWSERRGRLVLIIARALKLDAQTVTQTIDTTIH